MNDLDTSGAAASEPGISDAPPQRKPWQRVVLMALPLVGFLALAVLFWFRLGDGDPSKIPSALIGRAAPQTALPPLEGLVNNAGPVPGLDPGMFKGKVSIVNVWASWCVPCHDEAPLLTALGQDKRLQLVGINYKDSPDNARRFLGRYGNPFGIVGVDGNGRAAIEWGVYGVPETFIVGRTGTIVYKLVGPVNPDNIDTVLKPEIEKALKAGS
jgi:cytochrome c biogenesis protein CcmG, thiol:disulfide interchange protein DsbE